MKLSRSRSGRGFPRMTRGRARRNRSRRSCEDPRAPTAVLPLSRRLPWGRCRQGRIVFEIACSAALLHQERREHPDPAQRRHLSDKGLPFRGLMSALYLPGAKSPGSYGQMSRTTIAVILTVYRQRLRACSPAASYSLHSFHWFRASQRISNSLSLALLSCRVSRSRSMMEEPFS